MIQSFVTAEISQAQGSESGTSSPDAMGQINSNVNHTGWSTQIAEQKVTTERVNGAVTFIPLRSYVSYRQRDIIMLKASRYAKDMSSESAP